MRISRLTALTLAASAAALAAPAAAMAESTAAAPQSTPSAAAPAAPGRMTVKLANKVGSPAFAIVGERMYVHGSVAPYVPGQQVKVSFYREGRLVQVQIAPVFPVGARGEFRVSYASRSAGAVEARVAHYATAQQVQFTGRSPALAFVNANLGPGSSGTSVRVLQAELAGLHFAVPQNGYFDEATGRALIAYRKLTGLERVPYSGQQVFKLLERGAGTFPVRYRGDGRHIEADLTTQVLAEIEPGGAVHAIYTMSSGKPSTPTVLGRFRVYRKEPGTNSHGMVDSSYFISGYAIHGYAEVPIYAASHGCLRVPIPDAESIYGWISYNMPVDVYN